jgi:hypothetical protein
MCTTQDVWKTKIEVQNKVFYDVSDGECMCYISVIQQHGKYKVYKYKHFKKEIKYCDVHAVGHQSRQRQCLFTTVARQRTTTHQWKRPVFSLWSVPRLHN